MATSSAVKYALKNGVAVLQITSPPVNALGAVGVAASQGFSLFLHLTPRLDA